MSENNPRFFDGIDFSSSKEEQAKILKKNIDRIMSNYKRALLSAKLKEINSAVSFWDLKVLAQGEALNENAKSFLLEAQNKKCLLEGYEKE